MIVPAREVLLPDALPNPRLKVAAFEDLDRLVHRVRQAQRLYARFSQEQVDRIFREAAMAASAKRIPLAKMAVEETGMGVVEDKVLKNHFASEFVYNKFKTARTCGIIECDAGFGIRKIAEPVGILAGIVPTTNPTSTAIFKANWRNSPSTTSAPEPIRDTR